jgi:hypothetical protein
MFQVEEDVEDAFFDAISAAGMCFVTSIPLTLQCHKESQPSPSFVTSTSVFFLLFLLTVAEH